MANQISPTNFLSIPTHFKIHEIIHDQMVAPALAAPLNPNLGPLSEFVGTWSGVGFNTIFRPDSTTTPTQFPTPVNPPGPSDNVLELNLTAETLSFSKSLGSIPNRGSAAQADAFLNGVPYLQTINDVLTGTPVGIHFEPGIWLNVPATANPNEPVTLARMASIPHGTTIIAQGGVVATLPGAPIIDPIDITPFVPGAPQNTIPFRSQTAANQDTSRIPQDLSSFMAAGTITQAMLTDPNSILRNQIKNQIITQTVVFAISTNPASPLVGGPFHQSAPTAAPAAIPPSFGGGPANIAFLEGVANPPANAQGPNAQSFQMDAVFWIETVQYQVVVPPLAAGDAEVVLQPVPTNPPLSIQPSFVASIPFSPGVSFPGGTVTVSTTQIQYSQKVILNFAGLSWPHVSVASLVPADPIPIPSFLLPLS